MFFETKPKLEKQKIETVQWSAIGIGLYSNLESNQSITAEVFC